MTAALTRGRVVHVTTTDISLALLLGPQLRAFAAAGYEVIGASAPGPWAGQLGEWGIEHRPLKHATRSMAPLRDVAAMRELVSLFRELQPDIVHTHNPKPGVYGRLAARIARVPVTVNTVHGLYALPTDPWPKRAVVYTLERIAASCSQAELLQNAEDVPVLRRLRIPAARLHLLGNGIDLQRFDAGRVEPARVEVLRKEMGAERGDVVCGIVGRLVWEKGYREVFDAARRLRERVPRLRFAIIGPFDDDKADAVSRDDIAQAEAAGNIRFLGMRDDVDELYAAMDCYALASYREGFPRSAMEAAASGLPIVATDIRGCRQVVDHERTGLLVPPRSAGGLATAIERLASDASLRATMGTAAKAKARREFDQAHVIDTTLTVYDRLLNERGRR
ncbi:MAG: glycosyltransferase [Actinomycetia bacterium]|nr:glycosyltransferase [Actinomycetes bacterium]